MMAGLVDLTINMREGLDYTVSEIQLTEASLNEAADAAIKAFDGAQNLDELAALRRDHLGDAAPIPQARRSLGTIPKDQRKDAGRFVNMALGRAEKHFAQVKVVLEEKRNAEVLELERVDVTVPTTREQVGALHPITILNEQIADIFVGMGWEIAEGPEVEAEYFNFDALNFLPDHPARTLQDTFHIAPEAPARCCVPTPHQFRCAPCSTVKFRSTSHALAVCSVPTNSMQHTPLCSTRSRPCS